MTGSHAHEYVGRHRKPDRGADEQQPGDGIPPAETGLLRRTFDLFTHPPLHTHKEK